MEKELTTLIGKETTKHFCTCDDLACALNPNNPDCPAPGCDPCIRKNLKAGEIPSCFFNIVADDLSDWDDFSIAGFVAYCHKHNPEVTK